jgi:nitrogen regulatory protein PII
METTLKKRLEIVIEAPVLERLTRKLDELDLPGYTVMPAVSGRGRNGSWSRKGEISDSQRMFVLFAILDDSLLPDVLDAVYKLVSAQIGIVTVSNVQVIRADHF